MAAPMSKAKIYSYMRNVGRSLGYSLGDTMKGMNPTVTALFKSTKEQTSEIYQSIKNFDAKSLGFESSDLKGTLGQALKDMKKNALEDALSGKWYNKERMQKYENEMASEMFGIDFDDFGNFDDFDFDNTELDEEASIQEDATKATVEAMDSVGRKTSVAISANVVKSADYIVESGRANTKAMYNLNQLGFSQVNKGLATVNGNLQLLVNMAEPLTTHMQNSAVFYTKSTEYQNKALELLTQIAANTAPKRPEAKRSNKPKSYMDFITPEGIIDFKGLLENGAKELKSNTELVTSMLSFLPGGEKGLIKMATGSPLHFALTAVIGSMFSMKDKQGRSIKDSFESFNKVLSEFSVGLLGKAKRSNFGDIPILSPLLRMARDFILPGGSRMRKPDMGNYEKGKVDWDGMSRKALMEVIPTQLSQILAAITGQEQQRFDYRTGRWTKVSGIRKIRDREINNIYKSAGGDLFNTLGKSIDKSRMSSRDKREYKRQLEAFIKKAVDSGNDNFLDILSNGFNFSNFGMDINVGQNMQARIREIAKTPEGKKMLAAYARNIYTARDRLDSRNRNMAADSIENALYNGSTIRNSGNVHNKGVGFGKPTSNLLVDDFGWSQHDYLRNILTNVSFIAKNLKNLVGQPGVGGYNQDGTSISWDPGMRVTRTTSPNGTINDPDSRTDRVQVDLGEGRGNTTTEDISNSVNKAMNRGSSLELTKEEQKFIADFEAGNIPVNEKNQTRYDKLKVKADAAAVYGKASSFTSGIYGKLKDSKFGDALTKFEEAISATTEDVSDALESFSDGLNSFIYDKDYGILSLLKNSVGAIYDIFIPKWLRKAGKGLWEKFSGTEFWQNTKETLGGIAKSFIPGHARGARRVNRTGLVAVSRGEMIIPSEMNPFYHGVTNKLQQIKNEQDVIKRFWGKYARGGSLSGRGAGINLGRAAQDFGENIMNSFSSNREGETRGTGEDDTSGDTSEVPPDQAKGAVNKVLSGAAKYVGNKIFKFMLPFLPKDKDGKQEEEKVKSTMQKMMEEAGLNKGAIGAGALIGGGASLLTGAFLGPIAGAAVGAAVGFVSKSETAQKILFGEEDKENGGRKGGIISKKMSDFIFKHSKSMGKGAGIGAIAGTFFGSPIIGAIAGSTIGFVTSSDKAKEMLFGKLGADGREGGLIPKQIQEFAKKALPRSIAGAAAGLLLGGPFGVVGNILLGSAAGAITSTNKFHEWLFGKDKDKIGEGGFSKLIKDTMLTPIVGIFEKLTDTITQTIKHSVNSLGRTVRDFILKRLGGKVKDRFMQTRVGKALTKAGKAVVGGAYNLVTAPIRGINRGLEKYDLRHGLNYRNEETGQYMTAAERIQRRQDLGMGISNVGVYERFDELLQEASPEELAQLENILTAGIDPTKQYYGRLKSSRNDIRKTFRNISDREDISSADRHNIQDIYNKYLNKGSLSQDQYEKAKDAITNNASIPEAQKEQLLSQLETLWSHSKDYNMAENDAEAATRKLMSELAGDNPLLQAFLSKNLTDAGTPSSELVEKLRDLTKNERANYKGEEEPTIVIGEGVSEIQQLLNAMSEAQEEARKDLKEYQDRHYSLFERTELMVDEGITNLSIILRHGIEAVLDSEQLKSFESGVSKSLSSVSGKFNQARQALREVKANLPRDIVDKATGYDKNKFKDTRERMKVSDIDEEENSYNLGLSQQYEDDGFGISDIMDTDAKGSGLYSNRKAKLNFLRSFLSGGESELGDNDNSDLDNTREDSENSNASNAFRKKQKEKAGFLGSLAAISPGLGGINETLKEIRDGLLGGGEEHKEGLFSKLLRGAKNLLFGDTGLLSGILGFFTGNTGIGGLVGKLLGKFSLKSLVPGAVGAVGLYALFKGLFGEFDEGPLQEIIDKIPILKGNDPDNSSDGEDSGEEESGEGDGGTSGDYRKKHGGSGTHTKGRYNNKDKRISLDAVNGNKISSRLRKNVIGGQIVGRTTLLTAGVKTLTGGKVDITGKGIAKGLKNIAEDGAKSGLIQGILKFTNTALEKVVQALTKIPFIGKRINPDVLLVGPDSLGTKIGAAIERVGNGKLKEFAAKAATALSVLRVVYLVGRGIDAWGNAESILGITQEATFGQKVIAVLVDLANAAIPFIGDLFQTKELVNIFMTLAPKMGIDVSDLQDQRDKAKEEVEEFNKLYGDDLTIEQYNQMGWSKDKNGNYVQGNARAGVITKTKMRVGGIVKDIKEKGFGKNVSEAATKALSTVGGYLTKGGEAVANAGKTVWDIFTKQMVNPTAKFVTGQESLGSYFTVNGLPEDSPFSGIAKAGIIGYRLMFFPQVLLGRAATEVGKFFGNVVDKVKTHFERQNQLNKEQEAKVEEMWSSGDWSGFWDVGGSDDISDDNMFAGLFKGMTITRRLSALVPVGLAHAGKAIAAKFTEFVENVKTDFGTFKEKEGEIWGYVKDGDVKGLLSTSLQDKVDSPLKGIFGSIYNATKTVSFIPTIVSWAGHGIADWFGNVTESLGKSSDAVDKAQETMKNFADLGEPGKVWTVKPFYKEGSALTGIFDAVSGIQKIFYGIIAAFNKMIAPIKNIVGSAEEKLGNFFGGIWEGFKTATTNAGNNLKNIGSAIYNDAKKAGSDFNEVLYASENSGSGSGVINQTSSRFNNIRLGSKSFADNGCGPASASMITGSNLSDSINTARKYQTSGGTNIGYFGEMFNKNGMSANYVAGRSLLNEVASGKPTVIMGRDVSNRSKDSSPFGPHNHYVVAKGINSDGSVNIMDSEQNRPRRYRAGILRNAIAGVSAGASLTTFNDIAGNNTTNNAKLQTFNDIASNNNTSASTTASNIKDRGYSSSTSGSQTSTTTGSMTDRGYSSSTSGSQGVSEKALNALENGRYSVMKMQDTDLPMTTENCYNENLGYWSELTAEEINEWIASKHIAADSPFNGAGEVFVQAANESGLDPRYIVAHAAIESGWGTSNISKKKHNYFGIGAFDSNPSAAYTFDTGSGGSAFANGIIEGAKWISRNYYHGKYGQTSVYKMRYNNNVHQYCTSETWVNSIGSIMATAPANTKLTLTDGAIGTSPTAGSAKAAALGDNSGFASADGEDPGSTGVGGILSTITNAFATAFGNLFNGSSKDSTTGTNGEAGTVGGTGDGSNGGIGSYGSVSMNGNDPVSYMKSIEGKIAYSMKGARDPEKGSADCSSTVNWAVKKATGGAVDVGGSTLAMWNDNNLTPVWYENGQISATAPNGIKRNDVLLFSRPNSGFTAGRPDRVGHVGLYIGDNQFIDHGGPGNGTNVKTLNEKQKLVKVMRIVDNDGNVIDWTKRGSDYTDAKEQARIENGPTKADLEKAKGTNQDVVMTKANYHAMSAKGSGLSRYRGSKSGNKLLNDMSRSYFSGGAAGLNAIMSDTGSSHLLGTNYTSTSGGRPIVNDTNANSNVILELKRDIESLKDNKSTAAILKAIVAIVEQLVGNTQNINNIYELLSNYIDTKQPQEVSAKGSGIGRGRSSFVPGPGTNEATLAALMQLRDITQSITM